MTILAASNICTKSIMPFRLHDFGGFHTLVRNQPGASSVLTQELNPESQFVANMFQNMDCTVPREGMVTPSNSIAERSQSGHWTLDATTVKQYTEPIRPPQTSDPLLCRTWSSQSLDQLTYESSPTQSPYQRTMELTPPRTRNPSLSQSPLQPTGTGRKTTPMRTRTKKPQTDETFVKRPLNSFMLYRRDHQHTIPTNNHQSISRIIGDMWRKESAEIKNRYDNFARDERERHQLEHPGYKFQPKKRKSCKVNSKRAAAKEIHSSRDETECLLGSDLKQEVPTQTGSVNATDHDMARPSDTDALQPIPVEIQSESAPAFTAYPFCIPMDLSIDSSTSLPAQYQHYSNYFDYDATGATLRPATLRRNASDTELLKDSRHWHYSIQGTSLSTQNEMAQPYFKDYSTPVRFDPKGAGRQDRFQSIHAWQNSNFLSLQEGQSATCSNSMDFAHALPDQEYTQVDLDHLLSTNFPPGYLNSGMWELDTFDLS